MKFKLDQNLPVELATDRRGLGTIQTRSSTKDFAVRQTRPVLDAAFDADRILFTLDNGIANIQRYPIHQHAG